MKVLLIYYTGTFNTRFLTDRIADGFTARGAVVTKAEVGVRKAPSDLRSYDLIGLGYPIYGFNSPRPFNRYLRCLRFPSGQKFFIYKNSGETLALNNASSRVILRILKRRQMDFRGEYHYIMPYNIRFSYDRKFIKEIFVYDRKLGEIMFHNLEHNIVREIKSNLLQNIGSFLVSVQKIGGQINSFFYRVDYEKCIKCMKCVNNCPNHNIIVKNGKIKFRHNCNMCMRCSYYCPVNAIKIGFLNKWKVIKYFDYDEIMNKEQYSPYISDDSKGFYKCFITAFRKIDEEYAKIKAE